MLFELGGGGGGAERQDTRLAVCERPSPTEKAAQAPTTAQASAEDSISTTAPSILAKRVPTPTVEHEDEEEGEELAGEGRVAAARTRLLKKGLFKN